MEAWMVRSMGGRGSSNPVRAPQAGMGAAAQRCLPILGTVLVLLGPGIPEGRARPAGEELRAETIDLRCQIGTQSWSECQMVIDRIGEHWWLVVGKQRFEFRHDGRGSVTMAEGALPPKPVITRWRSSGILCWDGLCAEGPIPLD